MQYISDERSLPTFWSEGEKGAMWGTSLARHCGAKSAALRREFEGVVASCEGLWWGGVWGDGDGDGAGCLELADWLVVDAMWRSRAMELSAAPPPSRAGSGGNAGVEGMECLVPIMDMANHHSNARVGYSLLQPPAADWPGDKSTTGNGGDADRLWAGLVFETPIFTDSSSKTPAAMINNNTTKTREEENTEEITISYGSMKGAAEMIFSYGFLDDHDNDNDNDNNDDNDNDNDNDNEIPDARSIMLGWTLPEDDPLRFEKVAALGLEPGIQIYTPVNGMGAVRFVGTAVWAMSINEEDGLRIVGTTAPAEGGDNDDDDVVKMFFKDVRIMSKAHLIDVLAHDRAALVFRARAYGYVYLRIEEEIRRLDVLMQEHFERQALDEGGMDVQASRVEMCAKLRELEYAFLKRALGYYADQLGGLMQHPDVLEYPVLMEKGRELPALTDTELWNRYEGEHDEENRRAYTGSLENSLVELQSEKKSGTAW